MQTLRLIRKAMLTGTVRDFSIDQQIEMSGVMAEAAAAIFSSGCQGGNTTDIPADTASASSASAETEPSLTGSAGDTDKSKYSEVSEVPFEKTSETPSATSSEPIESGNNKASDLHSENEASDENGDESKTESAEIHSENSRNRRLPENSSEESMAETHGISSEKTESSVFQTEISDTPSSVSRAEDPAQGSQPESSVVSAPQPSFSPIEAESVSLNTHQLTMTVGERIQLSAVIFPADTWDRQLTWYWSDTSVITMDEQAAVTAVGAGSATITVKTNNGRQDTCKVIVKEKEQPKPPERSEPEASNTEESTGIGHQYAAYYSPYDWDAVITDLRSVGEKQYGMTWEDSLWVRNHGREWGSKYDDQCGYEIEDGFYHGNCQFGFPVTNTESADGERLRNSCLHMFIMLQRNLEKSNDLMSYTQFKIAVEDVGINDNGEQEYWIYLLHT